MLASNLSYDHYSMWVKNAVDEKPLKEKAIDYINKHKFSYSFILFNTLITVFITYLSNR